ncbi:MAG: AI-2E family transporter [Flavobacteriales bacterium]
MKLPDITSRKVLTILAIAAFLCLLYAVRSVVIYIVLGLIISLICEPLVTLFGRLKIRGLSIPIAFRALLAMALFMTFVFGVIWIFFPLIQEEYRILQSIDVELVKQRVIQEVPSLQRFTIHTAGSPNDSLNHALNPFSNPEKMAAIITQVFGVLGSALAGIFATLFIAFFFLKDGSLFSKMVHAWVPENRTQQVDEVLEHIHVLLRRYFIGVLLQSLLIFIVLSISLGLCGVNNALVIALFAAVVNPIPYAGPIVAMAFGLFAAVTTGFQQNPDLDFAIVSLRVLLCFLGTQLLDAFLIQPNLLGNSVKAHPLEIFLVILIFGTLGGIVGMLMAIPVYTILRVVAKEFLSEYKVVRELTNHLDEN